VGRCLKISPGVSFAWFSFCCYRGLKIKSISVNKGSFSKDTTAQALHINLVLGTRLYERTRQDSRPSGIHGKEQLSQPSWHVRITGEVFKYTDARLLPWGF
jgi:hypothetical protein